jgi:Iap family predicted aminopeptidase
MTLPHSIAGALATDLQLWPDFLVLCDCGGRLAGTPSEAAALAFLRAAGTSATGSDAVAVPTPYVGWTAQEASLTLLDGDRRIPLACLPLIRSVSGSVTAEVVDLGRGTGEEFAQAGAALAGRIALVRHEYMFASGHLHRRAKYAAALRAGASGFLIAGPLPTGVVAGSSGRGDEPGIPALGISPEAAARLSPPVGHASAALHVRATEHAAATETLLFDLPGVGPGRVVLSAHLDGHAPGESALDNATGVAAALAVARALAPHVAACRRGLLLAFFSAEEWALTGSRVWLDGLSAAEHAAMALNVNLDPVAGSSRLTALTSEFPALPGFVRQAVAASGGAVGIHPVLMNNSDHANFAAKGIPALRLVAGFDAPESNLSHVLTAADTRDKAAPAELHAAAHVAAAITWAALTADDAQLAALRVRNSEAPSVSGRSPPFP